jgi:hypothetical protein
VFDQLKRTNETPIEKEDPSDGDTVGKIKADADSTQLRAFINNLGTEV